MAKYNFNLEKKELIENMRSPAVYNYNMAMNYALLSNDPSVIRRFFQVDCARYLKDEYLQMEVKDLFLGNYTPGQAFSYFGIIPMIVQGKVNLVASNGFECKSENKKIDDALNKAIEVAELKQKFIDGAYWESGIGDVLYRISYDPSISDEPIVDVIDPAHFEVNYSHGKVKSYIIKEVSPEDETVELDEIHFKNKDGYVCIDYRFKKDGKFVAPDDKSLVDQCRSCFPADLHFEPAVLPFRDYLIEYKQNASRNKLYKGERGVPDIQGMLHIEDALSESISDLMDAIRKGGVKEYVSEELIPQDVNGNALRLNPFNKTVITTKGSSTPGESKNLIQVVQGDIHWEAYTRTIQNLMSVAINKAGLSPTTLGLTGLESINSSADSQDAREKPSMRTRAVALDGWEKTLKSLLNKYLQCKDYIMGRDILDYTSLINIKFNEYTNPTLENITNVLSQQVANGLKSRITAIKELNDGLSEEQCEKEFLQIVQENGGNVIEENKNVDVTEE